MASTDTTDNPFRKFITADGSSGYLAESNRYHLYSSNLCPFAQRATIVRKLKGLEDVISITTTWKYDDKGWAFTDKIKDCTLDPFNNNFTHLRQVYQLNVPGYNGTVSVPALYDQKTNLVVNNESGDMMQMFNSEFNKFAKFPDIDLYPKRLKDKMDDVDDNILSSYIYFQYGCLLAKTQADYEKSLYEYFTSLDKLEDILSKQRYLCGDQLTDCDIKFYVVLIRFDSVYYMLAKINLRRITDYPNLLGYLRELYQIPAFKETLDIELLKETSFTGFQVRDINPSGIIPKGPVLDLTAPHGREKLPGKPY
ncbi:Glutathionyl-hydroquinone reductase [Oopsacas minuta]|uniref:Glutathionyl-hydroquinone reductase n=1 Tax=Oopsacas minuta TaxID=111878 RepID=A0AAV7JJU1_9METZ|nr:Glutathionyl-hydroquinone reductase [Oopsacas minuta]